MPPRLQSPHPAEGALCRSCLCDSGKTRPVIQIRFRDKARVWIERFIYLFIFTYKYIYKDAGWWFIVCQLEFWACACGRCCCVGADRLTGAGCWGADVGPNLSNIPPDRGWRPELKYLKDDKSGGKKRGKAEQFDSAWTQRRAVWGGGGAAARRHVLLSGEPAAGGMRAPRRPRQTRLLPRFCVCGVGLLAAAWIFNFSDVKGAPQRNMT